MVLIIDTIELTQLDYALASRSLPVYYDDPLTTVRIDVKQRAVISGRDVIDGIVDHRRVVVAYLERDCAAGRQRQRRRYEKQLPRHCNTSYF
jgi:hypothetical protein